MPAARPMARFITTFGELGEDGAYACCTTDRFTGETILSPSSVYKVDVTCFFRLSATELAIPEATLGSLSTTEMSTSMVSVGLEAVTDAAKVLTVVFNPKSSMTGCSTDSVFTNCG